MSTELPTIERDSLSEEVSLTSFFGGVDRGRCVQLTQSREDEVILNAGIAPRAVRATGFVQLTQLQAIELIGELIPWLSENETVAGVLAEKLDTLA